MNRRDFLKSIPLLGALPFLSKAPEQPVIKADDLIDIRPAIGAYDVPVVKATGPTSAIVSYYPYDQQRIMAIGSDGTIAWSENGGATWNLKE